jgi:gamma-glutamylcyclotransferase (GGCT)/AIG2-like uncharacterized protein YtfP
MEKIFVYGTLQDPAVQQRVIGRVVTLRSDKLNGYKIGRVKINGNEYPIAIVSCTDQITGNVLEVTKKELLLMDEYETKAYKRISVTLASGQSAWLYCRP